MKWIHWTIAIIFFYLDQLRKYLTLDNVSIILIFIILITWTVVKERERKKENEKLRKELNELSSHVNKVMKTIHGITPPLTNLVKNELNAVVGQIRILIKSEEVKSNESDNK